MHIVMLGSRGIPVSYGGVETAVENLSTRIVKKGHRVTVICMSHYTPKIKNYKGVEIKRLPAIKTKHLEMISHTIIATLYLFFKKFDLLHIHSVEPAIVSPLLKWKYPIIATSQGQAYRRDKWGRFAKAMSKLAELVFIYVPDRCVGVSKTLCKIYKRKYGRNLIYIPNAIDNTQIEDKAINAINLYYKFGLQENNFILFIGRLIPSKGVRVLIDAYNMLETDMKLAIVGKSSYMDKFLIECKKNCNENILFLGHQKGQMLEALYNNCKLIVFPSEVEGLSLVLLESFKSLKPVIFSDIPENMEVGKCIGIPFKVNNAHDLLEKIKYVIKNPNPIEHIKKKVISRLKEEYNWDVVVDQYNELYKSCCNQERRKHSISGRL